MNQGKYILLFIFSIAYLKGLAQEISIHPRPKIDTVWYTDITEDSKPKPISCEENSIGYFRLKFNSEIIIDDFKKDTILTKKEDWEKEDEEAFDEEYNKEKKAELDELKNEYIEEDEDIISQTKEEIDRFIDVNWNRYNYNICKPDCESSVQQCYIYHEITQLKDVKKTYRYRTNYSWLKIKDEGKNEVEIDFDLVISYETLIYFFVTCSCDNIPDLLSVPSRQLNVSNPWAHIDLLGETMKPGYPFVINTKSFPIIPVLGGIAGGAGVLYLLTHSDESDVCNFNSTTQVNHTTCGDLSGSAEIFLTPPSDFLYEWSSGQTTSFINNVAAGNYSVTVTPQNQDCPKIISVTINDEIDELIHTISTTNSDCGNSNGSAEIDNPALDASYDWSNGSTGFSAVDLAPGHYFITATRGSCSGISEFSIMENEATFITSGDILHPTCGQADGTITTSVSPQGNYSFQWSTGDVGSTISSLKQGIYSLTITELETNCMIIKEFILEDLPADFTLIFSTTDATCGVSDGSISVEVDAPGSYIYLWSNTETSQSITNQAAGDYEVTVTLSDSECSITGTSTIEEKPFPLNIEFITTNANCGLPDGEIELQLTPEGNYTFEWSDGQTEQNIKNLFGGTYSVTITDQNGCTSTGSSQLESKPIIYIEQLDSSPGTCIASGEITLTLTTPGDGPIITNIAGPNIQESFALNSGNHVFSSLIEILPGKYVIEVYDENAGQDCNQTVEIIVDDNTPDIQALEDNYETEAGESVSGNVLDNDQGLNISVDSFFDPIGGTATINADGSFQFIPFDDFQGDASFNYIIEDACGSIDTALVIIFVNQFNCTFSVQFDIDAASCGLEDGNALALVNLPGNYSYLWSNGSTSTQLTNVSSGTYGLTITEIDLECDMFFEVIIPENEPSYVSNLNVIQPFCSTTGDILFDLNSFTPGPFLTTVSHPNGIDAFVIPEGPTFLSDYINIVSGSYTISIYDSNAGPTCSETFTVLIEEAISLTIAVIEIIPPSSFTANDGAAIIQILAPTDPPYTVWLDGVETQEVTEIEFIVFELGIGEHSIYITDITGCISNIVEFLVPPPMIPQIDVGVGIISSAISPHEQIDQLKYRSRAFIDISAHHQYLGMKSTTSFKWISPTRDSRYALTHFIGLINLKLGIASFSLKGGGIVNYTKGDFHDPSWAVEFKGSIYLPGPFRFEAFMSKSGMPIEPIGVGIKLVCDLHQRDYFNSNKFSSLKSSD